MNNGRVKRTKEITDRLKKLQDEHGYSNAVIARKIGMNLTTYKNYIRNTGGVKTISFDIIQRLSQVYDCSTDYIICKSEDPKLSSTGKLIIHPISFADKDKMISSVVDYLNQDMQTLRSLHFLFCKLPTWYSANIISGINSFMNVLKQNSFWEYSDTFTKENFDWILNNLSNYDNLYSTTLMKLVHADTLFRNQRFYNSLQLYVEIIYLTITKSINLKPIAIKAMDKISTLRTEWLKFPESLIPVVDDFPKIVENGFLKIERSTLEPLQAFLNTQKKNKKKEDVSEESS